MTPHDIVQGCMAFSGFYRHLEPPYAFSETLCAELQARVMLEETCDPLLPMQDAKAGYRDCWQGFGEIDRGGPSSSTKNPTFFQPQEFQ